MRRAIVALLLVAGAVRCGDPGGGSPDLAAGDDLAVGDDLAAGDDLAMGGDLAVGGDLAIVDLAVPPLPPDLATSPDLTPTMSGDGGPFAPRTKVDVLFMVDNSPSMGAKQALLHQSFAAFVTTLQNAAPAHPASYHIGVITDDLGAGPYTLNAGQCHPGGDGAKLQSAPSPSASGVPAACGSLTLGGGVRFIDYDQIHNSDNLGGTDVATAFTCISSVGEQGCGFEHPLEATYEALHDGIAENAGFLRADALLVVVFVTDEDDCSAPATTDLFDPSAAGVSMYGPLHSFRCTQYGIACGNPAMPVQPIDSNGPLSMCRPLTTAEGGKLIDVQKYLDYFGKPASLGGIKVDPSDVILASIAAPRDPVATAVSMPCVDQPSTASCATLDHSCVDVSNVQIFGDPAVRLATVVGAAPTSQQTSACADDYSAALTGIAQKIVARLP